MEKNSKKKRRTEAGRRLEQKQPEEGFIRWSTVLPSER